MPIAIYLILTRLHLWWHRQSCCARILVSKTSYQGGRAQGYINPISAHSSTNVGLNHNKSPRSTFVVVDGCTLDITSPGQTLPYRCHHPRHDEYKGWWVAPLILIPTDRGRKSKLKIRRGKWRANSVFNKILSRNYKFFILWTRVQNLKLEGPALYTIHLLSPRLNCKIENVYMIIL